MKNTTSSKGYFGYIRVSTARQGQTGISLTEQRSSIESYATANNLHVVKEFQEQETAARGGRRVFQEMIASMKDGQVSGLIMHKIDRGARNLKDWAELGELIDAGMDVHFANEQLDLFSRGGRLSADIQAVVAADYIRNLREEVKKGFYGRIKQGLFPMPAPLGYINQGGGRVKLPDPVSAPLIKQAFELYATGKYSLDSLTRKMNRLGLRGRKGQRLGKNCLTNILHNHFYTGIIRLKAREEYFPGVHQPMVSERLFDRVQDMLKTRKRRNGKSKLVEAFLFRRLVFCRKCRTRLIAERQISITGATPVPVLKSPFERNLLKRR
jgi:DNA invertase Pin-like site-specific DNA recombinase